MNLSKVIWSVCGASALAVLAVSLAALCKFSGFGDYLKKKSEYHKISKKFDVSVNDDTIVGVVETHLTEKSVTDGSGSPGDTVFVIPPTNDISCACMSTALAHINVTPNYTYTRGMPLFKFVHADGHLGEFTISGISSKKFSNKNNQSIKDDSKIVGEFNNFDWHDGNGKSLKQPEGIVFFTTDNMYISHGNMVLYKIELKDIKREPTLEEKDVAKLDFNDIAKFYEGANKENINYKFYQESLLCTKE